MRRREVMLVAVIVMANAEAALAQAPAQPVAGTTVRVTVPPRQRVVGTLVSLDADSIVLKQRRATLRLPMAAVTRMEVAAGQVRYGSTIVGAALGALIGGVVGGAVGAGSSDSPTLEYVGSEGGAATGVVLGAAAGALVGGAFGYNRPRWRWKEVPIDRIGTTLRRGEIGVRLAVGF